MRRVATICALYILAISLVCKPSPSYAVGVATSGGNPTCASASGYAAIPVVGPLIVAIICTGANTVAAIEALQQSNSQAAQMQANSRAQATASTITAQAAVKNATKHGAQNLPTLSCDGPYVATSVGAAVSKTAQEATYLNSQAESRDNSIPATGLILTGTLMQTPATLTPLAIFGADDISTGSTIPSASNGMQYINSATNPIPEPPVPANQLGGPLAAQKLARYDEDHAGVALAQKVLNDILAMRMPVANLSSWQQGVLGSTGIGLQNIAFNSLNATSGNAAPTEMSLLSVIGTSVASRFANPAYFTGINADSEINAVKAIATTQTIELEVEYQNLIAAQNQEALLAVILARLVNAGRF